MQRERGFLIAGASAAGLSAARALRRAGYAGAITLLGGEAELPYDRPPLSKQFMEGGWDAARLLLVSRAELDGLALDLRLGVAAAALDVRRQMVTTSDGAALGYDGLLIATGVRPRPIGTLAGLANVHGLRTIDDARRIRQAIAPGKRLAIIGAGFIGTELAATARQLQAEVALIEQGPSIAGGRLGALAGERLAQLHASRGVRLRLGNRRLVPVVHGGRATALELDDGALACDEIVVAVGAEPCTEWLAGSGLDLSNGVVCDAFCRAAHGVYAAGDVASWRHPGYGRVLRIEHRTNATEQAAAAAHNLLGGQVPYEPLPFFWSDQYEVKLQSFGILPASAQQRLLYGGPQEPSFAVGWYEGERLVGVVGWNAAKALRQYLPELTPWRQAQPVAAA